MSRSTYSVKLKNGTNEKWVKISAQSTTNASYVAEQQNAGWKAIDVREG